MPSEKPATPPGDGDTGSDTHCATEHHRHVDEGDAQPAQRAAAPKPHRQEQQQRAGRVAAQDRQQHAPVLLGAP